MCFPLLKGIHFNSQFINSTSNPPCIASLLPFSSLTWNSNPLLSCINPSLRLPPSHLLAHFFPLLFSSEDGAWRWLVLPFYLPVHICFMQSSRASGCLMERENKVSFSGQTLPYRLQFWGSLLASFSATCAALTQYRNDKYWIGPLRFWCLWEVIIPSRGMESKQNGGVTGMRYGCHLP